MLKVFSIKGNEYKINVEGLQLTISKSKVDELKKILAPKIKKLYEDYELITDPDQFSVKLEVNVKDLERFLVPVDIPAGFYSGILIDKNKKSYTLSVFDFDHDLRKYKDFISISGCKTFLKSDNETKEFVPFKEFCRSWKVRDEYGITAYITKYHNRWEGFYVKFSDVALALIIDASVTKQLK